MVKLTGLTVSSAHRSRTVVGSHHGHLWLEEGSQLDATTWVSVEMATEDPRLERPA